MVAIWACVVAGLGLCMLLLVAFGGADLAAGLVFLPLALAFLAFGALAARGALRTWSPDEKVTEAAREKFGPARREAPEGEKGDGFTDREKVT